MRPILKPSVVLHETKSTSSLSESAVYLLLSMVSVRSGIRTHARSVRGTVPTSIAFGLTRCTPQLFQMKQYKVSMALPELSMISLREMKVRLCTTHLFGSSSESEGASAVNATLISSSADKDQFAGYLLTGKETNQTQRALLP